MESEKDKKYTQLESYLKRHTYIIFEKQLQEFQKSDPENAQKFKMKLNNVVDCLYDLFADLDDEIDKD